MKIATKYRVWFLPMCAFTALALFSPVFLQAESSGPSSSQLLPASEHFLYSRTVGDRHDEVEVLTRLQSDKAESWYEISSHASDQDSILRLDTTTLFATYIEVTSRGKDATLRRVTTVLENRTTAKPDEIVLAGFEALPYSLRAFLWGSRQKATLSFMGSSGGGNFRFDLSVAGTETITVGDRGIECRKLQLSLSGIIGTFIGKSYLWYSAEYPHFLVRSEGLAGGPGTPKSVLSLLNYSISSIPIK